MKKSTITFIISINLVLILAQLIMSAKRATDGEQLNHLNQEITRVERENMALKSSLYEQSSLEAIQHKAISQELTKVAAQFMVLSQPVAAAR
jgi:cell division protein FtsL